MNTKVNFKWMKMAGIFLIMMLLSSTYAQQGQGRGFGPGPKMHPESAKCDSTKMAKRGGPINEIPGLTKDQEKKIEQSRLRFQKEVIGLRNQIAEKRAHLKTLSDADRADQTAIDKTIDELTSLQGQMMKKRSLHQQEIRSFLNDDQRLFFDTHKGHERQNRMGKRPGRGNAKQGKCDVMKTMGQGAPGM